MPEDFEKTIYKLELDESGYIRGVDNAAAHLTRFSQVQDDAKKRLDTNEIALKKNSERIIQLKKDVESYTGTNEAYRKQLQKDLEGAQKEQDKLNELVRKSKEEYDAAAKAAQGFADAAKSSIGTSTTPTTPIPESPPAPVVPPPPAPAVSQFAEQLKNVNLADLPDLLEQTTKFNELSESIKLTEERLKELTAAGQENSEEFQVLTQFVRLGKEALDNFGKITGSVEVKAKGFRQQITALQNELTKLEEAGKADTKEFQELEKQIVHLTKAYNDQRERIKILSSETRALDFGKAAITGAVEAMHGYLAVSILLGEKDEDLEKKTMQLFAAMQLLTALEGAHNTLKKNGIILTNLQSAAQTVYTFAIGATTGALKALRIALLATGVGAVIAGLILLAIKIADVTAATRKAHEEQKRYNDVLKQANGAFEEATSQVEELKINIDLAKQGFLDKDEVVKQYNDTIGKTTGQVKDLDEAEKELAANADNYIRVTYLKSAANIALGEAAKKAFEAEQKRRKDATEFLGGIEKAQKAIASNPFLGNIGSDAAAKQSEENRKAELKRINDVGEERKKASIKATEDEKQSFVDIGTELLKQAAEISKNFDPIKQAEKDFSDDLLRVQADISKAQFEALRIRRQREIDAQAEIANDEKKHYAVRLQAQKIFQEKSRELINLTKAFEISQNARSVELEKRRIQQQLDDTTKNLTVKQRADLNKELSLLSAKQGAEERVIREKTITELGKLDKLTVKQRTDLLKQVTDSEKKLADELKGIRVKTLNDTLQLLQDEFDKRAKLIDFNEKRELDDSKDAIAKRLEALDIQKLLLTEQEFQDAKAVIISNGEQTALNIIQKYAIERKQLAADIYKQALDAYREAIFQGDLVRDEAAAKDLRNLSDQFLSGAISFKKYQKEVTKIQREEEAIRRDATLATQRNELADIDRRLEGITDHYSKEYKDLQKIRDELRSKIASGEAADAKADVEDIQAAVDERVRTIIEYANAIGSVVESVISFWQKANEAEEKALDRSIALQERRVDAARRIAERGNAEYLQQEEDRLKELEIKRENAARRDLAINAALQASQLLVGITGAIAKIATGLGAAETIAEIAIIVGALATGYGLVKSLQGNQPKLFKGTPYLQRNGAPQGKDTIPAWLNEGEAVLPTQTNKNYKKAVEAIYYEKVPAETMNKFVTNYVTNRNVTNQKNITSETNEKTKNEIFRNNTSVEKSETVKPVYDTTNTNLEIYKQFVTNVSKVPVNVINNFVKQYEEKHKEKIVEQKSKELMQSTLLELQKNSTVTDKSVLKDLISEKSFVEKVKEIPKKEIQKFIHNYEAKYNQTIPTSVLNKFINTYHQQKTFSALPKVIMIHSPIKPLPIPNYQKIKDTTEIKVGYDGKIAGLISEQNKMLAENNDLQRATIRALRSMGVNVNVDKDGLAISVMEAVKQIEIDKRL